MVCHRRYVDVFEGLLGVAEDVLPESIRRLIADLPVDRQTFATALYEYESACEALIDVDVELEIDNVYSHTDNGALAPGYELVDVAADVVSLFPNGNVRDGVSLECRATTYLIYLSCGGIAGDDCSCRSGSGGLGTTGAFRHRRRRTHL